MDRSISRSRRLGSESRLSRSRCCSRGVVQRGTSFPPPAGLFISHLMFLGRAIVITTSSRKDRLERYLAVGDIHLTDADVEAIDKAGRKGERDEERKKKVVGAVKWVALGGVGLWALARMVL